MPHEQDELGQAVTEFLGRNGAIPAARRHGADPAAQTLPPEAETSGTSVHRRGTWQWVTNQPLVVQIVGGVIATLLASGIVALIAALVR